MQGGLNLGRALAKNLGTRHGGMVQVRGKGKGGEFTARLALVRAQQPAGQEATGGGEKSA